ncbi:MAG: flotillin family protein [Victivallaceae bacterium]
MVSGVVIIGVLAALVLLVIFISWVNFYRKCPSDRIMVIYGKTGGERAARCIHGGAKFVWPVFQDYGYISLRPMQIEVNLSNALCKQNIRISVPSVFTVGVSTSPEIMGNAAERLFGQTPDAIAELSKDIIFGQLRLVIASMTIEEINADRETFLRAVEDNVAEELKKIGLELLNVNITDITDESGYIAAIGKRAAAEAINRAIIDVAEEERKGSIGSAEAHKQQRIAVSLAEANAASGEANADRDRRIAVKQADSTATQGENIAAIEIAKSNAIRAEQEAEAYRLAEAARQVAAAQIERARFEAEAEAQIARAKMETERQRAEVIVHSEIERQKIEIAADAEAEKLRREARGNADAIYAQLEAEARGNFEILKAKAEGYKAIIGSCNADADAAAKMLLIEKIQEIVAQQAEAIKNIKIDKITVWDGGTNVDGKGATANFLSGMIKSLPPLQDVATMAGLELPQYLGKVKEPTAPDEK